MHPDTSDIQRVLEILEPLRGAPADCVERFRQESRLLRIPAGRHLFDEQAACNAFPKCRRGRIRVSKLGPGGREITLYRVTPGESCVLTSGCLPGDMPYTATATATAIATAIAETDIVLLAMFFVLEANAPWLGLIGLVPPVTAFIGWCPAYALIGVNTCPVRQ